MIRKKKEKKGIGKKEKIEGLKGRRETLLIMSVIRGRQADPRVR
jgi:hypothetical protein